MEQGVFPWESRRRVSSIVPRGRLSRSQPGSQSALLKSNSTKSASGVSASLRRTLFPVAAVDAAPRAVSLFSIIWMFAAIVVALLILADFSFGLLSSARAYVG